MKKLLLVSLFQNVTHILKKAEPKLKGKTIAYIPTAALVENSGDMIRAEMLTLSNMGLIPVKLEISSAPYEVIDRTLSESDFLFVSGGNTFFLLQEMKRIGADKLLIREVEKGKLYIGESAGAMIASPDIGYSAIMDAPSAAPRLTDYSGLGLVPFYVVPHYKSSFLGKEAQNIKEAFSHSLSLKLLTDHQALLIEGERETLF